MDSSVTELTQFGVIEINGEDAGDFLQSQLTSDIQQLNQQVWQFSAWCNPQGRIISNFICIRTETGFLLLLTTDLVTTVCRRLGMYILRSRVAIRNCSENMRCYGLIGEAVSRLQSLPVLDRKYIQIDLPDKAIQRTIVIDPVDSNPDLLEVLQLKKTQPGDHDWLLRDIRAGFPWISEKTSELIIPQELELEKLDALSLNKGCFPGQEIIARLHYRGKVKYGLYRGESKILENIPQPSAKLFTTNKGESCGTVINSVNDGNKLLFLAVINHTHVSLGSYFLEEGQPIDVHFTPVHKQAP